MVCVEYTKKEITELMKNAGLYYDWFIEQAKEIVEILESGNVEETAVTERMNRVLKLFRVLDYEKDRKELLKEMKR